MTQSLKWINKYRALSFLKLWKPILKILSKISPLKPRGNRPLKMDFEHPLKTLIFFHLEEQTSASHLLQVLKEDDFASEFIAHLMASKKAVSPRPIIRAVSNSFFKSSGHSTKKPILDSMSIAPFQKKFPYRWKGGGAAVNGIGIMGQCGRAKVGHLG